MRANVTLAGSQSISVSISAAISAATAKISRPPTRLSWKSEVANWSRTGKGRTSSTSNLPDLMVSDMESVSPINRSPSANDTEASPNTRSVWAKVMPPNVETLWTIA